MTVVEVKNIFQSIFLGNEGLCESIKETRERKEKMK